MQIQGNLRKLVESIEKNTLVETSAVVAGSSSAASFSSHSTESSPEDSEEYKVLAEELAILATELESKCLEVQAYKDNFERLQSDCSERTSEVERINSQLQKAKVDGNTAVEKLKKTEEDLANIKEKNAQLSDELLNKSRQVFTFVYLCQLFIYILDNPQIAAIGNSSSDVRVQEMQKKCDELQKKLDAANQPLGGARKKTVKFACPTEPETVITSASSADMTMSPQQVKRLEEALEAAAKERQEILEAAEKEIEYHRSIAAELETSMINDFEWKLHEIESEYNRKLREGGSTSGAQASSSSQRRQRSPLKSASSNLHSQGNFDHDLFELKLQQAKNEIVRQKDEELAKMHIQIRKEMDDKLRLERNSLKSALDASHSTELSKSVEAARKDAEREAKISEKKIQEDNDKLQAQISNLQREIAQLNQKVIDSVNNAVAEGDKKVKKNAMMQRLRNYYSFCPFRHLKKEKEPQLKRKIIKTNWRTSVMISMGNYLDCESTTMTKLRTWKDV